MNLLFPRCNIGKFNYIEMYLVTNVYWLLIESWISFMNTIKKAGPSTLPWGVPLDMADHNDISLLTTPLLL